MWICTGWFNIFSLCVLQYVCTAGWIFDISVCCFKLPMLGTCPWPWVGLLSKKSWDKHIQVSFVVSAGAQVALGYLLFSPPEVMMKRVASPPPEMVCKQSCLQAQGGQDDPSSPIRPWDSMISHLSPFCALGSRTSIRNTTVYASTGGRKMNHSSLPIRTRPRFSKSPPYSHL